jgi:hypothetical protein
MPTNDPAIALTDAIGEPSPGPAARAARGAGQAGGALVLIQLWQAFGWFGAEDWTAEEAGVRWPAVTAALILAVTVLHNLWNYLHPQGASSVAEAAVRGALESTRLQARDDVELDILKLAGAAIEGNAEVEAVVVTPAGDDVRATPPVGAARMGRVRPRTPGT